jgi:hypothetical protein
LKCQLDKGPENAYNKNLYASVQTLPLRRGFRGSASAKAKNQALLPAEYRFRNSAAATAEEECEQ